MAQESTSTTNGFPNSSASDVPIEQSANIIEKVVDGVVSRALNHADARTVYGEPVKQGDRTVIPVAKVSSGYGFGAGTGQGTDRESDQRGSGGGGGGGGKVDVKPIGYIEVTPEKTQYMPIVDASAIALRVVTLVGIAAILGILFASRGSKDN